MYLLSTLAVVVDVERHGAQDDDNDEKERYDNRRRGGGGAALGPVPPDLAVLAGVVVRTLAVRLAVRTDHTGSAVTASAH